MSKRLLMYQPSGWSVLQSCSCYAMIRYGLLMEQDQASKQIRYRAQSQSRRVRRKQNRSLPPMKSKRFHRFPPQSKRLRFNLDNLSLIPRVEDIRLCRSRTNHPKARFSGWFLLTSGVLRRVLPRLWGTPAVGEHGPFLRTAEFCASSLTTNAKRLLPIPDNDCHGLPPSGMLLAMKDGWECWTSKREISCLFGFLTQLPHGRADPFCPHCGRNA